MTAKTVETNNAQEAQVIAKPDFGEGRYSPLMEECWKDAQTIFGLESAKAEKLARNIANEFGAWMATKALSLNDVKIGKTGKDGKITLGEAAMKVKGATLTHALLALKALKFANESMANGFVRNETQWMPNASLQDYFLRKL